MLENRSAFLADEAHAEVELAALENTVQPAPASPAISSEGFQLPRAVWGGMIACYAAFFGAMALATGGSGVARFMVVISVLYAAIYFGLARILAKQTGAEKPSPIDRGEVLQTATGPMDAKAVFGQVLVVPIAVAIFGIGVLIILSILG